jgi:hypothetical protein
VNETCELIPGIGAAIYHIDSLDKAKIFFSNKVNLEMLIQKLHLWQDRGRHCKITFFKQKLLL